MDKELIILPAAKRDAAEAYEWYEERQIGLGEEFLRSVDACLRSLQRLPILHRVVYKHYRRAIVRKFPYSVFYDGGEKTVVVYSIFHTSQDPKKWRKRLP